MRNSRVISAHALAQLFSNNCTILVPRPYDLLVSGWIVGPGNSRYRMSLISRHPVAHAQCDKLPLRLLSIIIAQYFSVLRSKDKCTEA